MVCSFTDDEIQTFLEFIQDDRCYFKALDGRVQRNIDVFNKLAEKVNERFPNSQKTGGQWRTKWKNLKSHYLGEKREASKSGTCTTYLVSS